MPPGSPSLNRMRNVPGVHCSRTFSASDFCMKPWIDLWVCVCERESVCLCMQVRVCVCACVSVCVEGVCACMCVSVCEGMSVHVCWYASVCVCCDSKLCGCELPTAFIQRSHKM